ncbi:hypothetical protein SAMN05216521_11138 [Enterocloster clostridioformis]|uniref:Uncharacterized protein n=1 Tax=Enterocloster clostridioformis TaxID=1531 RepID=A0A1I0KBR4_9FIRM|nr:hypothetical protein SAMN05216521_11138 [Enterocloster clostridioformis]SEW49456.1 hypothetical protein SAMN05216528_11094 [Enterocloster clostridioformis]
MECDYKGVIYCKKEIGLSGDGRPFCYPISRRLKLRANGASFCGEDSQDWKVR